MNHGLENVYSLAIDLSIHSQAISLWQIALSRFQAELGKRLSKQLS